VLSEPDLQLNKLNLHHKLPFGGLYKYRSLGLCKAIEPGPRMFRHLPAGFIHSVVTVLIQVLFPTSFFDFTLKSLNIICVKMGVFPR
jgi:hypothetical protein